MSIEFEDLESLINSVLEGNTPTLPSTITPEPAPEPEASLTPPLSATPALDAAMEQLRKDAEAGLLEPIPPEQDTKPFSDSAMRTEVMPMPTLPTFTNEEIASALDVRNFATLATLNTARWHAKVKDRKASKDIAAANNADEHAFETRKRLLAGADEKLKAVHKIIDAARTKYYEMTLPWTTVGVSDVGRRTGARLLPNTLFGEFIEAMADYKAQMNAALDDFVPAYPDLVEQAKQKLGTRFDISEYPHADTIRRHFDLSFDFHPVPQGTDFKGLPEQQCQKLAAAIEAKTQTMVENAMQDVWLRTHEAVSRMAERLSSPEKQFHYTLVDNIRSVAKLLGHLNVTGDARVEHIRSEIEKHLCQHDVEDLRKNPTLRTQVAAHAQSILDDMNKKAVSNV